MSERKVAPAKINLDQPDPEKFEEADSTDVGVVSSSLSEIDPEEKIRDCPQKGCGSEDLKVDMGDESTKFKEIRCKKCDFGVRAATTEEGITKLWNCQG